MELHKKELENRSAREVFEDHLELAQKGELETDLERNYSGESVLLTNYGVFHGREGMKEAAKLLKDQLPGGNYNYELKLCHDEMCFLHWTGKSDVSVIPDGADSYLIKNGKIMVQTIYYSVQKLP
ncbi:nuclear transport factor 2 family protein [Salinimicrobium sp. HB62]|uniref:nuclear transport factor 2 family protein n=1 Tax=Salinimicrobium sp. HB62 TaxID=3077781 RepID=UPI002D7A2FA8|nr:nuclear transport factor 2 family protein [Salinimicrobium sp. HB62]